MLASSNFTWGKKSTGLLMWEALPPPPHPDVKLLKVELLDWGGCGSILSAYRPPDWDPCSWSEGLEFGQGPAVSQPRSQAWLARSVCLADTVSSASERQVPGLFKGLFVTWRDCLRAVLSSALYNSSVF